MYHFLLQLILYPGVSSCLFYMYNFSSNLPIVPAGIKYPLKKIITAAPRIV